MAAARSKFAEVAGSSFEVRGPILAAAAFVAGACTHHSTVVAVVVVAGRGMILVTWRRVMNAPQSCLNCQLASSLFRLLTLLFIFTASGGKKHPFSDSKKKTSMLQ